MRIFDISVDNIPALCGPLKSTTAAQSFLSSTRRIQPTQKYDNKNVELKILPATLPFSSSGFEITNKHLF